MAVSNNLVMTFFTATRAYSLPISVMSWLVPFLLGIFSGGNVYYGLVSLFGIIVLHLATNIFDDAIDYTREKKLIDLKIKNKFNFQAGKCACIFDGILSLKQYYMISFVLFLFSLLFAFAFMYLCGLKLLFVIIPCIFICLLYPVLGCLGLGEVLVSIVFSPLIYSGVYYVMTGVYSYDILLLSISTGLLAVAVLHNHMLLDFRFDLTNRKVTLCRLVGSEKKALVLLGIFIILSYFNLVFLVFFKDFSFWYLLPLFTIFQAVNLIKIMYNYIGSSNSENFLNNFKLPQKLLTSFTILLCMAIVADKCI